MKKFTHKPVKQRLFAGKRQLLLLGLVILALAGGIFGFKRYQQQNTPPPPSVSSNGEYLNLDPPTEEDKKEAEDNKQNLAEKQSNPAPAPSSTASVIITYAGQYESNIEVASYVSNIYEEGGTCTLVLTKGSSKLTKTTTGMRDVRNTVCRTFSIPRSEFPAAGTWNAVVSYTSQNISGTSESRTIEVN